MVRKIDSEAAWDYAIGMIKVDGLEPTAEFLKMVEKEKNGEMNLFEIEQALNRKYKMKGDKVSGEIFAK
jgi:hypothetical protein